MLDDLPLGFRLPERSLQRVDIPAIPFKVVREAIVNAVMHRDYRIHEAIQIIRYANRIEIRNPGYSLIKDEELGQPGSKTRNSKISGLLHDVRFAEKKGTGIGLMREQMKDAGLSPPVFESNRGRDIFVATFLFHHFLDEEDIDWLGQFKAHNLTDEQAKALIFIREVGAINNAAYRNLNTVDTLTASAHLRQLRDKDILISQNQGVATYYQLSDRVIDRAREGQSHMPEGNSRMPEGKSRMLEGEKHTTLEIQSIEELPSNLRDMVLKLSKKPPRAAVEEVIIALCKWKEMTTGELATLLNREKSRFSRNYLTRMVDQGRLTFKYPEMPKHPNQAYRAR